MIQNIFLTAAVAGILTVSMTDAFDVVRNSALNVVSLHETARQIDPWNNPYQDYTRQQAALYKVAGRLEGFANAVIELEFDQDGQLMISSI